ncbi:MAG: GNAT family N-acetyltransferase [Oscillospiraceae bacterium]|jgi:ribosomal protein S18 acetylase RimI-like enzyme|nr:GNAT family N-acetyltransferase [Oscillospiraceae bacterium]
MNEYEIVEVTSNDLDKCESFWGPANNGETRLAKLMNSGERRAFAYKINNEYVGGCAISIRNNEQGKYGHLSYMSVRSDMRNNGIGSCIIDFTMNFLRKIGINTMRLNVNKDNPSAIRLYTRNGFIFAEDITPEKIAMKRTL